jgi:hypothetical protein
VCEKSITQQSIEGGIAAYGAHFAPQIPPSHIVSTRVDIEALISMFMVLAPSFRGLYDAAPRVSGSGDRDGGAVRRAPREHSIDHEADRGSNEPIEQSTDPARITRYVQGRHQNC